MIDKPKIDYSFIQATIHLRPWKDKIDSIIFLHDEDKNLLDELKEFADDFKKRGLYKRRTIEGVSIFLRKKIKL